MDSLIASPQHVDETGRMNVLVTGGAGYIGSQMVRQLVRAGYEVTVIDNLSTGHADAVPDVFFTQMDIGDTVGVKRLLLERHIDAVMHFAGFIQVGESVRKPAKYYRNNVINSIALMDACVEAEVKNFVFSSSAAVYGEPNGTVLREDHPCVPLNPYGSSKLIIENVLLDYGRAHGMRSIAFRYFNAAGADPACETGERHEPETHLIPLAIEAALGQRHSISIHGDDYPTADGTCIRDYVHVWDICAAHLLALRHLQVQPGGAALRYNLGSGSGFSVREVLDTVERLAGKQLRVEVGPRRPGDPAVLVADGSLSRKELGWVPKYPDLNDIVQHAIAWHTKHHGEVHIPDEPKIVRVANASR